MDCKFNNYYLLKKIHIFQFIWKEKNYEKFKNHNFALIYQM